MKGKSKKTVVLVASGDLRDSANRKCWPAQVAMEKKLAAAFRREGVKVVRGHSYDKKRKHGFIASQREGLEVFEQIDPATPVVVAEAVWQYSHHVLPGLTTHRAPILTLANWSGEWPGLVGMLNLNGSLTKAGVRYSTIWSKNFTDPFFRNGLREWIQTGRIEHDMSHVADAANFHLPASARRTGEKLAAELLRNKAIMGIFDEGCMGMYNAIIPDKLLAAAGVFKERLSQSALYAATREVSDKEALAVRKWLDKKGLRFITGPREKTDLTDAQILTQCKMYIAAARIAEDFGCDVIGIQYQQGLKDLLPASDLIEGLLNNSDRPPVKSTRTGKAIRPGRPIVHFNEVDECTGLDALLTNRIWSALRQPIETTLHDVRWGDDFGRQFVWVFEISGAVPPAHFVGGYKGAVSLRQPPMYFRLGGGTIKGVSRPGEIVWSRIFIQNDRLHCDIGRAKAISLPKKESDRRSRATSPEWPMMHTVLYGITRDQFMARHKANHVNVAYATNAKKANALLATKVAMMQKLGIACYICGSNNGLTD